MSLFNNFLIQINQQLPPIITTANNIEISFDYQCDIVPSTGKIRFLKVTNNQQVFENVLDVNNIKGKEIIYSTSFDQSNPFIENIYYKVQIIFYAGGEYYSNYGISKCINSNSFFSNITYEAGDYYYNYYTDDEENYLNYYRYQITDNDNNEKILDSGEQIALSQENKFYNLLNLDVNMQFDSFKKLYLKDDINNNIDSIVEHFNNPSGIKTGISIEAGNFENTLQLNSTNSLASVLGLTKNSIQGYSDIGITTDKRIIIQNQGTTAYYTLFIPLKLFKIQNIEQYTIFNICDSENKDRHRLRIVYFDSTKSLTDTDNQIVFNTNREFNDSDTPTVARIYQNLTETTYDYMAIYFYYSSSSYNLTLKEVLKSLKIFQGKISYYPSSNIMITNKILLDQIPEIHFKDNYILKVFGKTNLSQKIYEEQDLLKLNVYVPFAPYQIKAENLINEGCISINLSYLNQDIPTASYENQQLGHFYLVRADVKHNFENWKKVQKFAINKVLAQTEVLNLKDYTVEQGIEYLYGIEQVNQYGIVSDIVKAKDTCVADFDDLFLLDKQAKIKIKFNPKISSFKTTKQESKIETLGSKYPYIIRNDQLGYKEFSISGLISFNMDDSELETFVKNQKDLNNIFMTYESYRNLTNANQSIFTDKELAQMTDSTVSLSANNFMKEREFKKAILDWLNNGEYKILKTPAEGNYIVQLTNISLTPNDTLGRMIHTFTATATEVLEYNYTNLINILDTQTIANDLQIQSFTFNNLNNIGANNQTIDKDFFIFSKEIATQRENFYSAMYSFIFKDNVDIIKININNFTPQNSDFRSIILSTEDNTNANDLKEVIMPVKGNYSLDLDLLKYKRISFLSDSTETNFNPIFTFEFKRKKYDSAFEQVKNIKYNENSFKIISYIGGKNWGNFQYNFIPSDSQVHQNYQLLNDESDLALQFNALISREYVGNLGRVIYAKNKYKTINEWDSSTLINKQVTAVAKSISPNSISLGLQKIKIYHRELDNGDEIVTTSASGGSLNNRTVDPNQFDINKLYKYKHDDRLYYLYVQLPGYYRAQLRNDEYLYSFWIGTENILNNSIYSVNSNYLNCRYILNDLETVNENKIYQPKSQDKYCLEINNTGVYLTRPDSSNPNLVQRIIVTTENILDYIDFIWIGGGLIAEIEYLQPILEIEGSN